MTENDATLKLRTMLRPVAIASAAITAVFFGGFAVWGFLAPLSSAAIAPGVVSPESSRKTIQHLEGGIVQEILVTEGDEVEEGEVLMRLSPTQARAYLGARQRQRHRLEAERLRLRALEQGAAELVFPAELADVPAADHQDFLATQRTLFKFQIQSLGEKTEILQRRIAQHEQEIAAIDRENEGLAEQLAIVNEEAADKERLLDRQLIAKPDVLVLRRAKADLGSRIAANEATIARAEQRINELELSVLSLETEFRDSIAQELIALNSELAQLDEEVTASQDVFSRTEIRAPVSGTVLYLRVKTVGGVVRPGEPILDLVPDEDKLLVEARLPPNDIDQVALGQRARVHLSPYAARDLPALDGTLIHVGADSLVDEVTREGYYEVRVEVDPASRSRLEKDVRLVPGMPAEVYIVTGEQSLFSYLAAPVVRSFRRAFRES